MAWRKPANIQEWVSILYRHKKKFFFPAIVVMIGFVIGSWWIPREYQADAIFERITDTALDQMGSGAIARNLGPIRRALIQDITGRASVEQLIEDLELTKDLPHTEDGELTAEGMLRKHELIKKLQGRINVRFRINTTQMDRVAVSYNDTDRKLAPKVVNQIVDNYIRRTRQKLDESLLNAKGFFEREVNRYRDRTTELESKKLRFELDHPGLLPDDPASVEAQLIELRGQYTEINQRLQEMRAQRTRLAEWVKTAPEFIERSRMGQNPEANVIYEKIAALDRELENHLYNMGRTDDHPAVIRARQRKAELQEEAKALEAQVVVGKDIEPNVARMEAEREIESISGTLIALEQQATVLSSEIEKYEILKRNFFVIRNEYVQMVRDLDKAKDQLSFWEKKLRDTTLALTAEIGQRGVRLRSLERAPELARPSSPTIQQIISFALIGGLASGAVMVLLAELMDHSFRNPEQAIDDLKLPVLGAVNEIVSPGELFRRKVLAWGVFPVIGIVMLVVLGSTLSLAYLSLNDPERLENLMAGPREFLDAASIGG